MEKTLVVPLRDAADPRFVGGKAFNLHRVLGFGLPVPKTFVLTAAAWRSFRAAGSRLMPTPMQAAVGDLLAREFSGRGVAVRSSGIGEDSSSASFAGQLESRLNLVRSEDVEQAIVDCWLSAMSDRVLAYQARVGGTAEPIVVGVIIQEMVAADSAGVLFSRNPLTGDTEKVWISSNFGLGSTVVDGSVVPDVFVADRTSGWIVERTIGGKANREDAEETGGVTRHDVDLARRREPSLSDADLHKVLAVGLRVEESFGMPIDIEWALADGQVILLQVRPITR